MARPSIPPPEGYGPLTPAEAKKYFEFFKDGAHKEALLLGDLVPQLVHFVKSLNHKVLCRAQHGVCPLCADAGNGKDVSTRQTEYYAASYVRPWRLRVFEQRVAVFSEAAGARVLDLLSEEGRPTFGARLDIERHRQGSSSRFTLKLLPPFPRGVTGLLPQGFDLVPWLRARYGNPQDPARPLVFLPPFKAEAVGTGGSRPRLLDLSPQDFEVDLADRAKARDLLRAHLGKLRAEETAADTASPAPPPAAQPPESGGSTRRQTTPRADAPADLGHVADQVLGTIPFTKNGKHAAAKGGV